MRSIHLLLAVISGSLHFFHRDVSLVASATLMRRPSKSECKRYAKNNNACENHAAFMKLYCDKFLTCIEHDREVRDIRSGTSGGNDDDNKGNSNEKPAKSFYDLEAKHILGPTVKFNRFRGKVVLIVNVASECGKCLATRGFSGYVLCALDGLILSSSLCTCSVDPHERTTIGFLLSYKTHVLLARIRIYGKSL